MNELYQRKEKGMQFSQDPSARSIIIFVSCEFLYYICRFLMQTKMHSTFKSTLNCKVGDPLSLVFEISETGSPYKLFVRDLVAMDGQDTSEILLIDSTGS